VADHPFSLTGKHILITGASSGIGRSCAVECAKQGAILTLLGRNKERLQETQQLLPAGVISQSFSVELTDYELVSQVVKQAVDQQGKLSGIIHSAGISATLPLRNLKASKVDDFLRNNVTSAVELSRLCTKKSAFAAVGGSIVFLSSVMGQVGQVGKTAYSLTKGAIQAGVRSMALELAGRNIRVNSISPGVVNSPMSKAAVYNQNEEAQERIKSMHPLGLGQPEDVAYACIYLLSDAARWVTGTNMIVDGGYTAH
jgi:NAD(P)-dependent dehydrogenase (short-subunit alcohol dehydrogenase family)